ncbi:MAG: hypothetical protein A3H97_20695 [Acidobacteria bacterium RIFCSPLOWO2_02_FULL_65_29]|nr:MAG: hypothetical protein A3H97_20695 [Acidobacteria bacterium RIFCSPLOWO2_02_FULL_65_29]
MCCGTKRLTEIRCPSDCGYLASAREHPPAVLARRQQQDVGWLVQVMRDFNERQSQIFATVCTSFRGYDAPALQPLLDSDVVAAASALAATFETASRGVIYEHRAASVPAERLAAAMRSVLVDAGRSGGSAFERDTAVVLRRLAEAVEALNTALPGNRRGFLDLLDRTFRQPDQGVNADTPPDARRLIVP